jgi:tetratricopeptide (TPR) repeat protein
MKKPIVMFAVLGLALSCAAQPNADRGDATMHWKRAREAKQNQDYDGAVQEISKAIQLSKDRESKDMFIERGDLYFAQGNFEKAILDYVHAVELSKRNAGEVMGGDAAMRTRTFDLAPIYEKLSAS